MADAQVDKSIIHRHYGEFKTTNNNNHPFATNNNHRTQKQRKRRRLNQVVDKLATQVLTVAPSPALLNNNNNNYEMLDLRAVPKAVVKEELAPYEDRCLVSEEEDEVFSPASSSKSPHSSNTDSPKISFSPLRLKDSSVEEEEAGDHQPHHLPHLPQVKQELGCMCPQCVSGLMTHKLEPSRFFPISPVTTAAPVYSFEHYLHSKYLPDIFRRRSHSDSDLPIWMEAAKTERSDKIRWPSPSSWLLQQDSPLDLSMKSGSGSSESSGGDSVTLQLTGYLPPRGTVPVPVVKGDVASPTTKESVAVRYNLEVSPVVEEMPPGSDVAYVCPTCGQMFSLHDRLAKHMASRHKSKSQSGSESTGKAYLCEVCKRSFARSDMLTRHIRLHTGVKPYTCRVCGQVFSRSDHLSTHQRTHTGEKPYKCPQCPYAACRRDMITRHMRTHARYDPPSSQHDVSLPPTELEEPPPSSPYP